MKLYQQNSENLYYDFEDETMIDLTKTAITGNSHFLESGNQTAIMIINGDYYDDEVGYDYNTFEELKKITGYNWSKYCMHGYSQSDWQYLYYIDDPNCDYKADVETIEDFYMAKLDEFADEDNCRYLVPHRYSWKGKQSICEYLGLDPEDTGILVIDKKQITYTYTYKEIEI